MKWHLLYDSIYVKFYSSQRHSGEYVKVKTEGTGGLQGGMAGDRSGWVLVLWCLLEYIHLPKLIKMHI